MDRETVRVYDERVADWERLRGPGALDTLDDLLARTEPGRQADLGCGPGWHLGHLVAPAVALDASEAMVRRSRDAVPGTHAVVGDLEALPFRRGSITTAWAAKSYHHLRATSLPLALADLHRVVRVGGMVGLRMQHGVAEGVEGGDFPGRFFAAWTVDDLTATLSGAGFSVLDAFVRRGDEWIDCIARRDWTLPDFVGPGMRALLVGLNPSPYAADTGVGFARPGNRFWPAALAAGIVTRDRDPRDALRRHGLGMTDLVKRTTARASQLHPDEYRAGRARLEWLVGWLRPETVVFVGLSGYRAAVDPAAQVGWQEENFGGCRAYVMPNPSGANAHTNVSDLRTHLRAVTRR